MSFSLATPTAWDHCSSRAVPRPWCRGCPSTAATAWWTVEPLPCLCAATTITSTWRVQKLYVTGTTLTVSASTSSPKASRQKSVRRSVIRLHRVGKEFDGLFFFALRFHQDAGATQTDSLQGGDVRWHVPRCGICNWGTIPCLLQVRGQDEDPQPQCTPSYRCPALRLLLQLLHVGRGKGWARFRWFFAVKEILSQTFQNFCPSKLALFLQS